MKLQKRVIFIVLFMILISSPMYLSSFAKSGNSQVDVVDRGRYFANDIGGHHIKARFEITDELRQGAPDILSANPDKKTYHIIQFKSSLADSLKSQLRKKGVIFYSYIPDNSYVVKISDSQKDDLLGLDEINWIGLFKPSYKLDPLLFEKEEERLSLLVKLFDRSASKKVEIALEDMGATIYEKSGARFRISLNSSNLLELAQIEDVMLIEKFIFPQILNNDARKISEVNYIWDSLGLFGEGQTIAIADTGLDTGLNDKSIHDDLQGRILDIVNMVDPAYSPDDNSSDYYSAHGTHVAGTVLGNGNLSGSNPNANFFNSSFAGVAPKSSLYFQSVEAKCTNITNCGDYWNHTLLLGIPMDLYNLFNPAYLEGIRIHTNSWGSDCSNGYGSSSQNADSYLWNNSDMAIIFAAGNDGERGNSTIACPGTAKNVITVGALSDSSTIASYSSRGPVNDGRIKPDIVAPGSSIVSTRSSVSSDILWSIYDDNYLNSGGTSMATPHVAGIVALVREHFDSTLNISNPSSALIKAALINGAKNVSGPRPDFEQGWGKVDLKTTLDPNFPRKIYYFDNTTGLGTNEEFTYQFDVELDTSNPLKVTLVWTDYPGSELSGENLVNDLDLVLTDSQGNTYYGNDFSEPYNSTHDRINNVEQIDLENPTLGDYVLNVSAHNIVEGPQPFAVVISYGKYEQQITPISPLDDKVYDSPNISIDLSYSHKGYVNYSFDGGINKSLNMTDNLNFDSGTFYFLDGPHRLDLYARNLSGFLTDHEVIEFTIDTDPLAINSHTPQQNQTYSSYDFMLNLSLSDKGYLNFSLNGGATNYSMNSTDNLNFNYLLSNLSDGNYTLSLYSSDIVGNRNDTFSVNFSIDKISPVLTLNEPSNQTYNKSDIEINITLDEIGSAWYSLGGANTSLETEDNLTFNSTILDLDDGFHTLHIYAKDRYENYVYENVSFGVDNTTIDALYYNNVSPINVTKHQVPLNVTFSKDIDDIYYTHDGIISDLNEDVEGNNLSTHIDIFDYEQTIITLSYKDHFSNSGETQITINPNLVLNSSQDDIDGDGVPDINDTLKGGSSNINSNLDGIGIFINSSDNLSRIIKSSQKFEIRDNSSQKVLEFTNNFSKNSLDLTNVTIKKENKTNLSKMYLRGLSLEANNTKTLFFELSGTDKRFSSICLKDSEVLAFSQLSDDCSADDELYINSIPYIDDNYSISYEDELSGLVRVSGLSHSGLSQVCTEDWEYSWSSCDDGTQTATATDKNSCGTNYTKEPLTRTCEVEEDDDDDSSSSSGGGGSSSSTSDDDIWDDYDSNESEEDTDDGEDNGGFRVLRPKGSVSYKYDIYLNSEQAEYDVNYSGPKKVYIKDEETNTPMVYFDYDFSKADLDLGDVDIHHGSSPEGGYILVGGLELLEGDTKTIKLKSVKDTNKVCVKDLEIEDISQVTSSCDGEKEYVLDCNGQKTDEGYTCVPTNGYYSVSGLKHSAVMEYGSSSQIGALDQGQGINPDDIEMEGSVDSDDKRESLGDDKSEEDGGFWGYFLWIGIALVAVFIIW